MSSVFSRGGAFVATGCLVLLGAAAFLVVREPDPGDAGAPHTATPSPPTSTVPPSCADAAPGTDRCGAERSDSCCAVRAVPGGRYRRAFDGVMCTDEGFETEVSAFALDRYEVTVGRFRRFLAEGGGTRVNPPREGVGAYPPVPSSGWQSRWNAELPEDGAELLRRLDCGPAGTWAAEPGEGDTRPVNCIDWYQAFAFCAWDGGRLPTEAEWNLAAAGGAEERERPWTTERPSTIERADAVFGEASPFEVGSCSPRGDARWGHADMVGNVWEWTLDAQAGEGLLPREGANPCATVGLPRPCRDCVGTEGEARVLRGAGFGLPAPALRVAIRRADAPSEHHHVMGVRCARPLGAAEAPPSEAPRPSPSPSAGEASWGGVGTLRGFSNPSHNILTAEVLDLQRLRSSLGTAEARVLLVRTCAWDPAASEFAAALQARSGEFLADGIAVVLVLVEGSRRGQAADVINLATFASTHGLTFAIATADSADGRCDGATLLGGEGLEVLAAGTSRDALADGAPLFGRASR